MVRVIRTAPVRPAWAFAQIAAAVQLRTLLAFVGFVLALLVHGAACAQYSGIPVIAVIPASPAPNDMIRLLVDSQQICRPLNPTDGISTAIAGNVIYIRARVSCPLVGVPPPARFVFSVAAGQLPAGTYRVEFSIEKSFSGPGIYFPPELLQTAVFTVGGSAVTSIPTLSAFSLLLLSLLVAIGAHMNNRS